MPGAWDGTHLPALDGLRGLGVAGVLAFHDRRLGGGWLGVDLFFTLSGFLITSLLVAELDRTGAVRLGPFWRRRGRRLLPALFALVAVLVAWGQVSRATPWSSSDLRGSSLATLGYVGNWYQAFAGGGYWSQFAGTSPLRHTWSLAIEEQFYVLFPLVVWACTRRARRPVRLLLGLCLGGLAASLAATLVLGSSAANVDRVYLGTDTRVASVLVGAALACVLALRPRLVAPEAGVGEIRRRSTGRSGLAWLVEGAGLGALIAIAASWFLVDGQGAFGLRGGLTLHALLVSLVIAVVVRRPRGLVSRALGWRPLVLLGTISYGLYLWHWPVFLYVDQHLHLDSSAATAVKVTVSLVLAVVSLVLIERPIRRHGVDVVGGLIPTTAMVVAVVVGACLLPAPSSLGATPSSLAAAPRSLKDLKPLPNPSRGPSVSRRRPGVTAAVGSPTGGADAPTLLSTGEPKEPASVLDRPGRLPGPLRLLVLGDSVPYGMAQALIPHQNEFGLLVANRSLPACSPGDPDARRAGSSDVPVTANCTGMWERDGVEFDPDLVIVSFNADVGLELAYDGTWGTTCSKPYLSKAGDQIRQGVKALTARGGRVFFWTPLINQESTVRLESTGANRECLGDLERSLAARSPGVFALALGEWLCPDAGADCRTSVGGDAIPRPDNMHLADDAAIRVWRRLMPQMYTAAGLN